MPLRTSEPALERMSLPLLIALVLPVATAAHTVVGGPPPAWADVQGFTGCEGTTWSEPTTISEGTRLFYATAAGSPPLVFGNWIPGEHEMEGVEAADSLFAAFQGGGEGRLPHPEGDFQFLYPVSVTDATGGVHLIWGESQERVTSKDGLLLPRVSSVWHSLWENETWTPPEQVFSAPYIVWAGRTNGVATTRGSVFVSLATPPRATIMLHRGPEGTWNTHQVPNDQRPDETWGSYAYTALAADDTVAFLAQIASDPERSRHTSVYVSKMTLGSGHWDQPVALFEPSTDDLSDVRLTVVDGKLHAIWLRGESGRGFSHSSVQHATSRDGGRTWTQLPQLEFSPSVIAVRYAVDSCGRVHVVMEPFPGVRPRLEYHRWSEMEGWQALEAPFTQDRPAAHPWLGKLPSGEPILVYTRTEYTTDPQPRWIPTHLRMSTLGPSRP